MATLVCANHPTKDLRVPGSIHEGGGAAPRWESMNRLSWRPQGGDSGENQRIAGETTRPVASTMAAMGHVLSLRTVYEIARVTLPTYVESFRGEVSPDLVDDRLAEFARRVVANTRMELHVEGRERVPSDRAFVYMSNHQSHMDIPVLYATIPARTLRMVAKKELFRIPFWHRVLRAVGMIEVDRQHRSKAVASLEGAAAQLRRGTSIWIAPEGTRSRTGELGPLKKGGFHLARSAGAPIIPVALTGTHSVLPPGTLQTRAGCRIRVVFGEPIDVEGHEVADLMADVESFLRANVGR